MIELGEQPQLICLRCGAVHDYVEPLWCIGCGAQLVAEGDGLPTMGEQYEQELSIHGQEHR